MPQAPSQSTPRIVVVADHPGEGERIAQILRRHLAVDTRSPGHWGAPIEGPPDFDLVVLHDSFSGDGVWVASACASAFQARGDRFVPILHLGGDSADPAVGLEAGADGYLRWPAPDAVLLAQVMALLRLKAERERIADHALRMDRAHRRLRHALEQVDRELSLARKIQLSLMPRRFPDLWPARFAACQQHCDRVCGDFYDVLRLDERSVAFHVADAMGHGIPASLLTIYLKKALVTKEIFREGYRLLEPNEVLDRLNADLLDQQLSNSPFITLAYFLLDASTLRLRFARAGHPAPLLIRQGEPIRELFAKGTLLGVFETRFEVLEIQLLPGDQLLAFTDGIDGTVYGNCRPGRESFLGCVEEYRDQPVEILVERVYQNLFPNGVVDDDVTVLGLEILKERRR